jgi:valyl-tRNA synthetase
MRNKDLEEEFDTMFKCVSLVYAARQQAKLKRRWPLSTVVVVAPKKVTLTLRNVEPFFLELCNVKSVEYSLKVAEYVTGEKWASAQEGELHVFVSGQRDEKLLGEGLMRDLARRVQALRKELGYVPTDVLDGVHIAELDDESAALLQSHLEVMAELVRAKKVHLHGKRAELETEWHETELDGKRIFISIH